MKPNPYYKDEKEKEALAAKRDAFTFAEPTASPRLVILLAGREGSGKTHLACTMNQLGPVYLIDTEYRAQIVTSKFQGVKFTTAKSFAEIAVAVKHIIKYQEPGPLSSTVAPIFRRSLKSNISNARRRRRSGCPGTGRRCGGSATP